MNYKLEEYNTLKEVIDNLINNAHKTDLNPDEISNLIYCFSNRMKIIKEVL